MPHIRHGISSSVAVIIGLWSLACGPSVVDLGARGGGLADGGVVAAGSGAGGEPSSGTGGFGQVDTAGMGMGGMGVVAVGGTSAGPSDSGTAPAPDANMADAGTRPSAGCGVQPLTSDSSITLGGLSAGYIVDLPPGYDKSRPYPLVMSFRGAMVAPASFRRYLDLTSVVGADGIVVTPDCAGAAQSWDLERDLPFFDALLAKLEANYCVDQRRVFVVGHATGAVFVNTLACMRAELLRGLGSLSGSAPSGPCSGGLAVWISQGNADMTRNLGRAVRDFWIQQDQCNATILTPVDPSPCVEYEGCTMDRAVRYCEYDGSLDLPSFAASGVWSFFKGL